MYIYLLLNSNQHIFEYRVVRQLYIIIRRMLYSTYYLILICGWARAMWPSSAPALTGSVRCVNVQTFRDDNVCAGVNLNDFARAPGISITNCVHHTLEWGAQQQQPPQARGHKSELALTSRVRV